LPEEAGVDVGGPVERLEDPDRALRGENPFRNTMEVLASCHATDDSTHGRPRRDPPSIPRTILIGLLGAAASLGKWHCPCSWVRHKEVVWNPASQSFTSHPPLLGRRSPAGFRPPSKQQRMGFAQAS